MQETKALKSIEKELKSGKKKKHTYKGVRYENDAQ